MAITNTRMEAYPQKSVWPRALHPSGKCVKAASAVPPADAKAPNHKNDRLMSTHKNTPSRRFKRMKPWKMLSPVKSV